MNWQTHEWTNGLIERLHEHGYRSVSVDLGRSDVLPGARRADFRSSWAFTRLHTFIVVQQVDVATADDIEDLSQLSTTYAVRNKGGLPRGFQTGVAVLPVLVCRTAQADALATAARQPRKQFAKFALPVLVELDRQRFTTYHEPHFWGSVYQDFLGEQQRLVAGELHGEVLPLGGQQRTTRWMLMAGVTAGVLAFLGVILTLTLRVIS